MSYLPERWGHKIPVIILLVMFFAIVALNFYGLVEQIVIGEYELSLRSVSMDIVRFGLVIVFLLKRSLAWFTFYTFFVAYLGIALFAICFAWTTDTMISGEMISMFSIISAVLAVILVLLILPGTRLHFNISSKGFMYATILGLVIVIIVGVLFSQVDFILDRFIK